MESQIEIIPAQQIDNFFSQVSVRPTRQLNEFELVYEFMFKKKGFFYQEIKNIARECIIQE